MSEDADAVIVEETGDGITAPIIYTLKSPVRLTPVDGEMVEQFEFMARKVSEITEYLDARGETREFHTFMRTFGRPLGIRLADSLIAERPFEFYNQLAQPDSISFLGDFRRDDLPRSGRIGSEFLHSPVLLAGLTKAAT